MAKATATVKYQREFWNYSNYEEPKGWLAVEEQKVIEECVRNIDQRSGMRLTLADIMEEE